MSYVWGRLLISALVATVYFYELCAAEAPNYSFMHEATEAPKISYFDYIVIGGGAAGIPLATTLSSKYSVLLLERGGSPYGNHNITMLSNIGSYFLDTSPSSPTQRFVSEGVVNSRARALGGGTCINAGFYSRGEPKFNKEARLMDESLVRESYEWTEKVMVFMPIVTKWQSVLQAALVEAGVTPDNGQTYDHLIGTKVSGTIFDPNGTRHTAADLLQYANPTGLSILVHATAHKILFKIKGRLRPLAYGVVFEDSQGNKHRAYLKGGERDEIILSAGALGSPQLLMFSGIGPKEQLDAHKIKVVLQQPFVGKGMADNPQNSIFIPSPIAVEPSTIHIVGITRFGSYLEDTGGFNFIFANHSAYQGFSPQEPEDLRKCVDGIRTIFKTFKTKAYSNYKYANMTVKDILDLNMNLQGYLPIKGNNSSLLEKYCKSSVRTMWHYHGGCQIGKVVDHEYKVFGVDALRVIDISTVLNAPGTNPQASVLMLGRYMGVTILNQRIASDKAH
ncbi:hypothetical protein SSX86_016732 [Deinandra increscens subsp. villosa]|uniref:Glucose-methanol-choline oxidoreductase N-terminal domain-containing protein n=1 Tax=Deinandra increscens subsp. villosa TaxID=3103831 RepID=A0AAP0D611_9ASTR